MPASIPDDRSGLRLTDRYVVFGAIAAGGMATVHYGRMLAPGGFARTVAIKRLHQHLATDPEFVAMFLDEARLTGRVTHQNVIPTLDVVATAGELFIVMEYVQGESLARIVATMRARKERIPLAIVVAIIVDSLRGLHAAHEARDERGMSLGIVHRDVSPQNILIGTDGRTRVFDFGVAKAAGRFHATRGNEVKGKIAYMAPEHLAGGNVTRAADIFAAGVVAWEALTTKRFHADADEARIVARTLLGEHSPPSSAMPETSRFDDVIMKALAKDPADRWATAIDMAKALEQVCKPASGDVVAEWLTHAVGAHLKSKADRLAQIELRTPASSEVDIVAPSSVSSVDAQPESTNTTSARNLEAATLAQRSAGSSAIVVALVAAAIAILSLGGALVFVLTRKPQIPAAEAAPPPPTPSATLSAAKEAEPAPTESVALPPPLKSADAEDAGAVRPPAHAPTRRKPKGGILDNRE